MQGIPLRKLVSAIGLTVAIGIAVVTPSVYFIHDYFDASEHMMFKARLSAARVAHNTSIRMAACGSISSCGLPS